MRPRCGEAVDEAGMCVGRPLMRPCMKFVGEAIDEAECMKFVKERPLMRPKCV